MKKSIKIIVCSPDETFNKCLCDFLKHLKETEVIASAVSGEDLLMGHQLQDADVILTDYLLPGIDGLSVTDKIVNLNLENRPSVCLTSNFSSDMLVRKAISAGASCLLVKPYDIQSFATNLITCANSNRQNNMPPVSSQNSVQLDITNALHEFGLSLHNKASEYLWHAISFAVEDDSVLCGITKILYPEIAKIYKNKPSCIERGIRNTIELIWSQIHPETLEKWFNPQFFSYRKKPTNTEFIATVSKKLRDKHFKLSEAK